MPRDLAAYRRTAGQFGRDYQYLADVASTNDVVQASAQAGAAEGLVVVAGRQTAGRGRLQRRWDAPAGRSLLMSLLFRPPAPFAHTAGRITMLCGTSLVVAIRAVAGLRVQLKWPNDLIIADAGVPGGWLKLAGMLSEVVLSDAGRPEALVVGVGVNVNVAAEDLPALAPNAGSLAVIAGREIDRADLLDAFLAEVDRCYAGLLRGIDPLPDWRAQLAWLGAAVVVRRAGDVIQGTAVDVDDDGALVLRLPDGRHRRFLAGDVSLRLSGKGC